MINNSRFFKIYHSPIKIDSMVNDAMRMVKFEEIKYIII